MSDMLITLISWRILQMCMANSTKLNVGLLEFKDIVLTLVLTTLK